MGADTEAADDGGFTPLLNTGEFFIFVFPSSSALSSVLLFLLLFPSSSARFFVAVVVVVVAQIPYCASRRLFVVAPVLG